MLRSSGATSIYVCINHAICFVLNPGSLSPKINPYVWSSMSSKSNGVDSRYT